MIKVYGVLALLAGLLFGTLPGAAHAADSRRPAVRSVCETGFRGQPAYDKQCLTHGTYKDGAALWLRDADGKRLSKSARRELCRQSRGLGGIRPAVQDWFMDVTYDHYRNYRTVLRHTGTAAYQDCRALGVRNI